MTVQPEGWRKSTRSQQQTSCVEVGRVAGGDAAVRDTKDRAASFVTVPAGQWASFVRSVKSGAFDC